jgi:DNA-binding Lrp family transcriptional regulator
VIARLEPVIRGPRPRYGRDAQGLSAVDRDTLERLAAGAAAGEIAVAVGITRGAAQARIRSLRRRGLLPGQASR